MLLNFSVIISNANDEKADYFEVIVNNQLVGKITSIKSDVIDNVEMISVREGFELLGGDVSWNDKFKVAQVDFNGNRLFIPLNTLYAFINNDIIDIKHDTKTMNNKLYMTLDSFKICLEKLEYTIIIDSNVLKIIDSVYQGSKVENFVLSDLNGEEIQISDFIGRKVVLTFWTTWCSYCKQQLPLIEELYLSSPDIELITINVGESSEVVMDFLENNNYSFKVLMDTNKDVTLRLGVKGVPTTFIIDKYGYISDTILGIATIDNFNFH